MLTPMEIIKEMQAIYLKFNFDTGIYYGKWQEKAIEELLGNISLMGCCLSELETMIGERK